MDKGELLDYVLPALSVYEGKSFTTDPAEGSKVHIHEVARLKNPETGKIPYSITLELDKAYIRGQELSDVTLVLEIGTEKEARHFLSQIQQGILSTADIITLYTQSQPNSSAELQRIIEDNRPFAGQALES